MNKYLQFQAGPYQLLLDIEYIAEISEHTTHKAYHGNKLAWHEYNILFIDMRSILDPGCTISNQPRHTLALKDINGQTPLAIIGIDEVSHIVEIADDQWHRLQGINPDLDIFFDRLYADTSSEKILLRLAPITQWANENTIQINNNNGIKNAH